MSTFSRRQHYWKIIYYILLYFPKGYSIYHTKQTVVTHLFTGRKQIISIHVNYIKTFIHIYIFYDMPVLSFFLFLKVQIVSAKLLRAFIITRSHICVPFCNLRKGPSICKPKILHFFLEFSTKRFKYETKWECSICRISKWRVLEKFLSTNSAKWSKNLIAKYDFRSILNT